MSAAYISDCGRYRYALSRDVEPLTNAGTVTFVMLNPSTADAEKDDPTVRRCIGFARRWGFSRLIVVNLYGYRATDPTDLFEADDPVGPENDVVVEEAVNDSDLVVCAWGAGARYGPADRVRTILDLIPVPHCLGLTIHHGEPRHPLYVKGDTLPTWFVVRS